MRPKSNPFFCLGWVEFFVLEVWGGEQNRIGFMSLDSLSYCCFVVCHNQLQGERFRRMQIGSCYCPVLCSFILFLFTFHPHLWWVVLWINDAHHLLEILANGLLDLSSRRFNRRKEIETCRNFFRRDLNSCTHTHYTYLNSWATELAGHKSIKTNVMFNTTFSVLIFCSVYSSIIYICIVLLSLNMHIYHFNNSTYYWHIIFLNT